jgi:hypothetical protein
VRQENENPFDDEVLFENELAKNRERLLSLLEIPKVHSFVATYLRLNKVLQGDANHQLRFYSSCMTVLLNLIQHLPQPVSVPCLDHGTACMSPS